MHSMQYIARRSIRPAALAAALAALVMASPLRADSRAYLIAASDLLNMPSSCGGGARYNGCVATREPGFEFQDELPAGSVVQTVTVEFNHAIDCDDDSTVFGSQFNGVPAGTFTSPNWCTCTARSQVQTLQPPASAYRVGETNSFFFTGFASCQGMSPDSALDGAYARVTVEFDSGSPGGGGDEGGGGSCDLQPVLEGIAAVEAKLDTSDHASSGLVEEEHDATRALVSQEAEAIRDHVTSEHETTRRVLEEKFHRFLVEQDLARATNGSEGMTASACLPEEFGGRLETMLSVVLETVDAYEQAGCNVAVSRSDMDRGNQELSSGSFVRACDWYQKAYRAVNQSCP